jgi:hypothetical protein
LKPIVLAKEHGIQGSKAVWKWMVRFYPPSRQATICLLEAEKIKQQDIRASEIQGCNRNAEIDTEY